MGPKGIGANFKGYPKTKGRIIKASKRMTKIHWNISDILKNSWVPHNYFQKRTKTKIIIGHH